jgi:hypothetical protein
MGNDQPDLRALFACESVLSEPEIGLERARVLSFDLAKEARQMAKFAWCPFAKTTANCSNSFCHFHLISSVSRPQRPLIISYDLKSHTLLQVQVKYQNTLVSRRHGMLNTPRRLHKHLNRKYKSILQTNIKLSFPQGEVRDLPNSYPGAGCIKK